MAQAAEGRAFAQDIRGWHPAAVAHLDDASLTAKVTQARCRAIALGITDPALRARFVKIDAALAPDFWRQPAICSLLGARTGTPDIRFGDVCAAIKAAMAAAGRQSAVWWS